jgi:DNA-binding CsgD family transcriptional regulator/pimeloyl-ACP methyl ester carboxylesterase
MAREVRYTTTSDGVQIGYAVSGSGPVLVAMPDTGFSSMLLAERDLPDMEAWAEAVSGRFTYVRYDARGYGFSQRAVPDLSLATWMLDLEAVVRALGLPSFALLGWLGSSRVALFYAAAHPDQVTHLTALPADYPIMASVEGRSLEPLARSDWEAFTETLAHIAVGWEKGQLARRLAACWRDSADQETYIQFLNQFHWPTVGDVAALHLKPALPVLAVVRRNKYLHGRIPVMSAVLDTRVVALAGDESLPYEGDTAPIIEAMRAFLEDGRVPAMAGEAVILGAGGDVRRLTQREREVLALLVQGKSNADIAQELVISVRTVERHLMRVYGKLGLSGKSARVGAAAHALLQAS